MFNKIQCTRKREIIDNFASLEDLVNYVRSDQRDEFKYILEARKFGKRTPEYDQIKGFHIPCGVINFNHQNIVRSSTIINPTGYLYLDIDNEDDIGNLDFNYIAAYWKSLSNQGYSIIVKVKGLTPHNLKESYIYIGNELDLKYDTRAVSKDRLTVLSYDPKAYFNDNVIEFDVSEIESTHYNSKKSFFIDYDYNGYKIRYDNLDEKIEEVKSNIIYNENGWFDFGKDNKLEYTKIFVPRRINEGNRNSIISSITHNLIALNPNTPKNQLFKNIQAINQGYCNPPLEYREVNEIFNKKYRQKEILFLKPNATRRFIFDPNFEFSGYDKRVIAITAINKGRVENSKNKIREAIKNWDYDTYSKITIKNLVKVTGMNKKTIQKYYKSIRDELCV